MLMESATGGKECELEKKGKREDGSGGRALLRRASLDQGSSNR